MNDFDDFFITLAKTPGCNSPEDYAAYISQKKKEREENIKKTFSKYDNIFKFCTNNGLQVVLNDDDTSYYYSATTSINGLIFKILFNKEKIEAHYPEYEIIRTKSKEIMVPGKWRMEKKTIQEKTEPKLRYKIKSTETLDCLDLIIEESLNIFKNYNRELIKWKIDHLKRK